VQPLTVNDFFQRSYRNIVFSGGGNRCWWQAGMVDVLSRHSCWRAERLIGASAGAGIATAFATGRIQEALAAAVARFKSTPRNIEWRELLKGKRPFMLPRIYSDWISSFLDAADLVKLKQKNIKVEVAVTRPIPYLPLTLSTWLALALYSTEKFWLKNFHARLPHYFGFRAEHIDLADSADIGEACTLLLASAAAVPLTPVYRVNGKPALDGGFYDSVPLPAGGTENASTLILLTRHRPTQPRIFNYQGRVYLQPAQAVPATNMDCTNSDNVWMTYEQGKREALDLLKSSFPKLRSMT